MARNKQANDSDASNNEPQGRRVQINQSDVPSVSIEEALRVPQAIIENYAGQPSTPLRVAKALDMQPNSGPFRTLCSAAVAYGLTRGTAYSSEIAVDNLGRRVLNTKNDADELAARREALLRPRAIGEFLRTYDGSPAPREDTAGQILIDMGIPEQRAKQVFNFIMEGAEGVGFVEEIKTKKYIVLSGKTTTPPAQDIPDESDDSRGSADEDVPPPPASTRDETKLINPPTNTLVDASTRRRVFITHGRNQAFVEPIKKLLQFGELEPVVAVERQSVSQPVPDKVMNDMRSCGATCSHVDAEQRLVDQQANEVIVLNSNVLIEIGAAMALYGRRIILLVREGVKLASTMQGLYEVRYSGDALDGTATIKLLEAINDIKNHPLPWDSTYNTEK